MVIPKSECNCLTWIARCGNEWWYGHPVKYQWNKCSNYETDIDHGVWATFENSGDKDISKDQLTRCEYQPSVLRVLSNALFLRLFRRGHGTARVLGANANPKKEAVLEIVGDTDDLRPAHKLTGMR